MRFDLQLFRRKRILMAGSVLLIVLFTYAYFIRIHNSSKFTYDDASVFNGVPVKVQPKYKGLAHKQVKSNVKVEGIAILNDFEVPNAYSDEKSLHTIHPLLMTAKEIRDSLYNDPQDLDLAKKREEIKNMTRRAWNGYVKYAWGHGELKPKLKTFHDTDILGGAGLGVTIVDAIDTLYIMGLEEEYQKAAAWIRDELKFDDAAVNVSVFEITIRFIGGLLSIFSMTGDTDFLDRAVSILDNLLPAFEERTGLPASILNLETKKRRNYHWASNGCHILSEIGTLHMEFQFISELMGNPKYGQMVHRIRDYIVAASNVSDGHFYTHVSFKQKGFCNQRVTLSGEGDSFYEYLLKEWIRTNHTDTRARELYDQALESFERLKVFRTSNAGSLYTADVVNSAPGHGMNHLACFTGGMLALGAEHKDESDIWFLRGKQLTETCHKSYAQTQTHLGPENFIFTNTVDAMALSTVDKSYHLRPETVESYFYMWRFTHDNIYRQYAWDVVEALKKHCSLEDGFSGIDDVTNVDASKDDVQQSYFLSETLKYLYLIFCDDSVFPLDRWVFNTEAHPFPITQRQRV